MPRINPIHLRRVNPITVSSAPGNVNLSAGTIATPRAASPAQAQFIGRDTQTPLVLGQQAADLANTLNSAITKRAQAIAASWADARAWADADPYTGAGVYAQVTVKPFKKVLP